MDSPERAGSPKTYITLEAPKSKPVMGNTIADEITLPPYQNTQQQQQQLDPGVSTKSPDGNQKDDDKVTKVMKQRYWHSWEELRLIELWRRYKSEVTDVRKSLPVFRKIVMGMRSFGFLCTAQDCRRKINTLTNRYFMERTRMNTTLSKSEWRLYPLIDCIMQNDKQWLINDPWHECVIIKSLLDKVQFKQSPEANIQPTISVRIPLQTRADFNIVPNVSTEIKIITKPPFATKASVNNYQRSSIGPLPMFRVTKDKLEQLKMDNERLEQQRDQLMSRLERDEQSFKKFEAYILDLSKQHESLLNNPPTKKKDL